MSNPGAADGRAHSIARRTLIQRAAVAGVAAWSAPAIIGSIASPAAAATGGCFLVVVRLRRDGNSGNVTPPTFSNLAGCATGLSGVGGCTTYTRITTNGTTPPGALTFDASYDAALDRFDFEATATGFPDCGFVGYGFTPGTGSGTTCDGAVLLTDLGAKLEVVSFTVPATDTTNVIAWAYLALRC